MDLMISSRKDPQRYWQSRLTLGNEDRITTIRTNVVALFIHDRGASASPSYEPRASLLMILGRRGDPDTPRKPNVYMCATGFQKQQINE